MNVTNHDKIRLRAFQIWEAEGRPAGRDLQHWLQAEFELGLTPVTTRTKPSASGKATAAKPAVVKKAGTAKPVKAVPKAAAPKRSKTAVKV